MSILRLSRAMGVAIGVLLSVLIAAPPPAVADQAPSAAEIATLSRLTDPNNTVNRRFPEVEILRRALGALGAPAAAPGPRDIYDDALVEALRAFQRRENLRSTGLPGAATRARLTARLAELSRRSPPPPPAGASPPPAAVPPTAPVAAPPAVRAAGPLAATDIEGLEALAARQAINIVDARVEVLRLALAGAGFPTAPTGPANRFDRVLSDTLRAFQEREGLRSTGLPGVATRERLIRLVVDNAPPAASRPAQPPPAQRPPVAAPPVAAPPAEPPARPPAAPPRPRRVEFASPVLDLGMGERQAAAIARYQGYAAGPAWPRIRALPNGRPDQLGVEDARVRAVARRLVAEGFLAADHRVGPRYDETIQKAVMAFQASRGLPVTGQIGQQTLLALNVAPAELVRALRASQTRMTALLTAPDSAAWRQARRVVVVNAAAATLQVVEAGKPIHVEDVVVGRIGRETPEFVANLTAVRPNPIWRPTDRMIRETWAPAAARDVANLARAEMRPFRGEDPVDPATIDWTAPPRNIHLRQRPGPHNALGVLRFHHDNQARGEYFLHGTPETHLFLRGAARRLVSSGCVRLRDPVALAALLTGPAHGEQRLRAIIAEHDGGWSPGRAIPLESATPLVMTYLTAWTDPSGGAHFRRDLYGKDTD